MAGTADPTSPMHLLLINPNTSPEVTDLTLAVARRHLPAGAAITAATGRFGARYIADRAAFAIAAHAALDAFAEHGGAYDGVLLACFGDPGLLALKEASPVPVVGLAEASCLLACALGRRFSIVTGGERWGPMLEEFVSAQGLEPRLAGVRTLAPTGAEIARDPDGALAGLAKACAACALEDGADVVVLGGAGLAGLARRIAPAVPVPVLCSMEAGVRVLLAAVDSGGVKAQAGSLSPPAPVESVGLSAPLAALLAVGSMKMRS